MDTSALMEKIEKGFTDLRAELGERMEKGFKKVGDEFTGLRGEFDELQTNVAAKIEGGNRETKVAFEALRHDLKIFDEDSTPGSTITLARRVTSLESRVKNLEKAR